MISCYHQSAPEGKQRYHFEGAKVQNNLQSNDILFKKDGVTLENRQYFNDYQHNNEINFDILSCRAKVGLQDDSGEEEHSFKGGDEE